MPKKKLKHLPEAEWPAGERVLFEAAFRTDGDLFDGRGPGAHLRPRTITTLLYGYRRWLGWVAAEDTNALALTPADRITPERVQGYVGHLRQTRNGDSVTAGVDHLYASARYMNPERDWTWLKDVKRRLKAVAVPNPPKAIPFTSQRLIDFGVELMEEAEEAALREKVADGRIRVRTALHFRDGLLIAFLGLIALRRSNIAGLSLGITLSRTGDTWMIAIDGESIKNSEPLMATLPDWLAEHLEMYLETFRPVFYKARHSGLWASYRGRPACAAALYKAFTARIRARMGVHVSLHDVRRIACTTWAIVEPETAAGARDLLGDRDHRVIAKHYNRARGIEASRIHQQNLMALRRELGQSAGDNQRWSSSPPVKRRQDNMRRS